MRHLDARLGGTGDMGEPPLATREEEAIIRLRSLLTHAPSPENAHEDACAEWRHACDAALQVLLPDPVFCEVRARPVPLRRRARSHQSL